MQKHNLRLSLLLAVATVSLPAAGAEKVLYAKKSPFSNISVTEDEHGLRTLKFDDNGVRQSVVKPGDPDHLELHYAPGMFTGLAFCHPPHRALIIGLGGGSLPMFLHKHYPETPIDVVDIDPDVVAVAKEYFGFREDATLRAHVGDGRAFIEQTRTPYDMIFLDAYGPDEIPYTLATREFLQAVRKALTPNGIVIGNVWGRFSNPLYDSMVRTYQDVFNELYIIDIQGAGNKILLASPRKLRLGRDELARRARAISRDQQFRFDLGELVKYGYQYAGEKNPQARVLLDAEKPKPKVETPQPPPGGAPEKAKTSRTSRGPTTFCAMPAASTERFEVRRDDDDAFTDEQARAAGTDSKSRRRFPAP